jgi:CRISPR-associated endonuclease/helicase Cas3
MDLDDYFSSGFHELTKDGSKDGYGPLRWQKRLFRQFCRNEVPNLCDLPTGLGKTSVIHIWLLALNRQILEKHEARLPTRLVYVVDRRTVVDQATRIAEQIKQNLPALGLNKDWLAVSTLRGQFADNREWTVDPSHPAIIIGTVDMIGSRLLFSGYRSSYKQRPLDAGMLGQDSLLILDEAHLSEPFAKLIRDLSDRGPFQRGQGRPMRVMCMSATGTGNDQDRFRLEECDLEGDEDSNPIVRRYEAKKRLTIEEKDDRSAVEKSIVESAVALAADNSRVAVFVQRPEHARKIAALIRQAGKRGGRTDSPANDVEVLTGTMRGLERDRLLKKPALRRLLDGEEKDRAGKAPAILVSTSAGEVGFDLNADHMACEAAPLDAMIQRLGRVNRRGYGDAAVHVFVTNGEEKKRKRGQAQGKQPAHTYESAAAAAVECLKNLPKIDKNTYNASPHALADLQAKAAAGLEDVEKARGLTEQQIVEASAPKPTKAELTDVLLDAWSMTSITERMPGRPQVAPWLRGIDDNLPQTTVVWRAELELIPAEQLTVETLEAIFQKHRIRPHETLTARTDDVLDFLKKAVQRCPSLSNKRVLLLAREPELTDIGTLIDDRSRLRTDPTLILPPSFGGVDKSGMLDDSCVAAEGEEGSTCTLQSLDVADEPRYDRPRVRVLLERVEQSFEVRAIPGAMLPDALQGLAGDLTGLLDSLKERLEMSIRLRQPLIYDDEGNVTRYLVSLYSARTRKLGSEQPLDEHVEAVENCAEKIATALRLKEPFASALKVAAKYHDQGKDTVTWQSAVGNKGPKPLGKSGGTMNVKRLGGYRHEFGTLLRLTDPRRAASLLANPESSDLALHLIAVHHGGGRPHFKRPDDIDYHDRKRCPEVAVEAIRRFARLQRKYGYWQLAWLENLLRCADAMASAENEEEET